MLDRRTFIFKRIYRSHWIQTHLGVFFKYKCVLIKYQTVFDQHDLGVVEVLDEIYNMNCFDHCCGPGIMGPQKCKLDGNGREQIWRGGDSIFLLRLRVSGSAYAHIS